MIPTSHLAPSKAGLGLVLVLAMFISSGCSNEPPSQPAQADLWEIDAAPTVVIGRDATGSEAVLNVVADATLLADGRIVVANGGFSASRLPVFSARGSYLRTIGRTGEGPGEYQWITSLQSGPSDSLFVFDASLQRLTAYAEDGGVRTTQHRVSAGGAGERLRTVTRLDSDTWAVTGLERPLLGELHEIRQDTVVVGILDGRLEGFQVLDTVPGLMSMTFEVGGRRVFGAAAFFPQALHAAAGGCMFVADGQSSEVSVYSALGVLSSVIETHVDTRAVSEEHKQSWIDYRMDRAEPEGREAYRQGLRDIPWVPELPYFNQMVADQWGRLWLQPYEPPTGLGRRWHLYAPDGERLGEVVLPSAMTVFEINQHGILGVTSGDFDEELVVLLPLEPVPMPQDVSVPCRT